MYKKSQITYFLIFALIIFIAAGFIVYITTSKKMGEYKVPLETQTISLFVESCIKNTGKDAILFVSKHGGYYNLPNHHYSALFIDAPYYFYQNLPFNPTKEQIEKQISAYMDENLYFCLRNFADFKKLGYDVEFDKIDTKTSIVPNKIIFELDMPIKLRKETSIYDINNFRVELEDIGLDKIIKINDLILKEQAKEPFSICLSCILNWTINFDLQARLNRLGQNLILFTIIDNNTIINQNLLEFNFVNEYQIFSCSNLPPDDIDFIQQCLQLKIQNITPELKIHEIPNFTIKVGEQFFYDVEAEGKNVVFEDFTDLFDVNPTTGIINFVPDNAQAGEHTVWISVKDILGNKNYENFEMNITR